MYNVEAFVDVDVDYVFEELSTKKQQMLILDHLHVLSDEQIKDVYEKRFGNHQGIEKISLL